MKAMRLLGASLDINDTSDGSHCVLQNIPLIFDVPHLMKSIRNNLKKHSLHVISTFSKSNNINVFIEFLRSV